MPKELKSLLFISKRWELLAKPKYHLERGSTGVHKELDTQ